jgi:hypothetical protein
MRSTDHGRRRIEAENKVSGSGRDERRGVMVRRKASARPLSLTFLSDVDCPPPVKLYRMYMSAV